MQWRASNPSNNSHCVTITVMFHIGCLWIILPAGKIKVPLIDYGRLFEAALKPPDDLNLLPYTDKWSKPDVRSCFIHSYALKSLELVETDRKSASLYLVQRMMPIDTQNWTGTTRCIILAPRESLRISC